MMDLKQAIDYLQPIADNTDIAQHGEALRVALDTMREKHAKLESSNAPLTKRELCGMIGEPVWVTLHDGTGGRWGIVSSGYVGLYAVIGINSVYLFDSEDYARAYRHKPEEVQSDETS